MITAEEDLIIDLDKKEIQPQSAEALYIAKIMRSKGFSEIDIDATLGFSKP